MIGLKDEDARTRRAVVEALSQIKTEQSYKALKPLVENGALSYYVEAGATKGVGGVVSASFKDKSDEVIELLKTVLKQRAGWNDVVRTKSCQEPDSTPKTFSQKSRHRYQSNLMQDLSN